jgi:hypothetical protein
MYYLIAEIAGQNLDPGASLPLAVVYSGGETAEIALDVPYLGDYSFVAPLHPAVLYRPGGGQSLPERVETRGQAAAVQRVDVTVPSGYVVEVPVEPPPGAADAVLLATGASLSWTAYPHYEGGAARLAVPPDESVIFQAAFSDGRAFYLCTEQLDHGVSPPRVRALDCPALPELHAHLVDHLSYSSLGIGIEARDARYVSRVLGAPRRPEAYAAAKSLYESAQSVHPEEAAAAAAVAAGAGFFVPALEGQGAAAAALPPLSSVVARIARLLTGRQLRPRVPQAISRVPAVVYSAAARAAPAAARSLAGAVAAAASRFRSAVTVGASRLLKSKWGLAAIAALMLGGTYLGYHAVSAYENVLICRDLAEALQRAADPEVREYLRSAFERRCAQQQRPPEIQLAGLALAAVPSLLALYLVVMVVRELRELAR